MCGNPAKKSEIRRQKGSKKTMKKQYVVFGAGRFGKSVALTLQECGCEVIVVDRDPEIIQDIADEVSYAICADVEDTDIFDDLGMKNLDGAIVAVTESLEASIITTMMCHEMGIPNILAKAKNEMHEKILRRVGATKVIYPEVEMGKRVARFISANNFADWIGLSEKYSIVEMKVPSEWRGKNLMELQIREKYHLNVIGVRKGDELDVRIDPKKLLDGSMELIVVGENQDLELLQD